MNSLAV